MFFKKELLIIAVIAAALHLFGCKSRSNYAPEVSPQNRIDLFSNNPVKASVAAHDLLSTDTAFKYCTYAVAASDVQLTDSSYNRTTRDNFYLYSAFTDSVFKGKPAKRGNKFYFTSYNKFKPDPAGTYLLYLLPLANHTVIRNNLHVQWEWMPNATFLSTAGK